MAADNDRGNPHFGDMLRLLRRRCGYKQAAFAEAIGVNPSAVSLYENGRRCPGAGTLGRIARTLGLTAEEFAELSWHAVTPREKARRDG